KVDDERAADARDEVQTEIDTEAVIGNRAIDTGFRRGKIGELAAEPIAERADFPDAFTAGPQGFDCGYDVLRPPGYGESLRTEHDIPLGRVKMAEFAQLSFTIRDIREQQ